VIDCEISEQKRRLQQRDGLSAVEVVQILAAQCQRTARLSYADDIIDNQQAINGLKKQVEHLHAQYLAYF
jgi:dephospho-CoA kinase